MDTAYTNKYYEIWRDTCGTLTSFYNDITDRGTKDNIMLITDAYNGLFNYVRWHKKYIFEDPSNVTPYDIKAKAREIMADAVNRIINKDPSKNNSAAFLMRILSGGITAETKYVGEYYVILQRDIFSCINDAMNNDIHYPSVMSFAEFSAFTNIDLDPDAPSDI